MTIKAIILSRVSTAEQEDGHSIDAQVDRLKEYCTRKEFQVIKVFKIIESSTRGKRKEFDALIEFAKKQKETVAIVADAVDRVQRGFKESVLLDDLIRQEKIELHFFREGMVIGKDASSSDIMRWDFSVMGAKGYVLTLSENVKRSLQYKRKNGEWCGPAPVGYKNARDPLTEKAIVEVDHERAFHIKRIFEEYASGAYSINEMAKRAKLWGLRNKTKKGAALSPSQVHEMLQNPFYYGEMKIKDDLYPHKYEPIITRELFQKCEAIRTGRSRTKSVRETKYPFVFRGLVNCAVTGKKVTSDIKKGKHIYLICHDPKNPEKKLFIPETKVLAQIEDVLKSLHIQEPLLESLTTHLKDSHESEVEFNEHSMKQLEKENRQLAERQSRLLDVYLDKGITQETYDIKQQELKQRQYEINIEMKGHVEADDTFRVTVSSLFSLASRAHELFLRSKNEQKRQLINFMFSNLKLKGEKLEYDLRTPFHLMTKPQTYQDRAGLIISLQLTGN